MIAIHLTLNFALIPVLTELNLLDLVCGISSDDAKKVGIRLGIPLSSIGTIWSTHANDPELFCLALILEWQKNHTGSERDAINQLVVAFRKSNLGSYATKLLQLDGQQTQLPQQHSPQSCWPAYPLTQELTPQPSSLVQLLQVFVHMLSQVLSSQAALLQRLPHLSLVQTLHSHVQLQEASKPSHHNLRRRPTCHHRINLKCHQNCHQTSHLKFYLAHCRHKRHLVHDRHRNFDSKHNCSTNGSIESYSNFGMIKSTPSHLSGGDITALPRPFLTPSGDDITTPDYALHQIHSTPETPHKAQNVTGSLSPFPTPRKEDDFTTPPKRHQMYPRLKELKVAEEVLKVFFYHRSRPNVIFNTIGSVGRCLLGDSEFESILKQEEKDVKMIVNRVFEEWKKKREGNIDTHELLNTFETIDCQELIDKLRLYLRRKTRLFSND